MRYAFSDCVLDTGTRELTRAGRPVKLRARSMHVLAYLIQHAYRVVPKEELFEKLWSGRIVGDATLNSCLKEVRRAVGDSGESQGIVRTLHGQGYRFVAAIGEVDEAPAASPPDVAGTDAARTQDSDREHKQVTVLACSIADAEGRAATLGAERMDELVRAFFARARDVVTRYGGSVSEWRGDGLTALFGAPVALEDHARCAVLAALELRTDDALPVRIGLHTGDVVVGRLGDNPFTALGATTRHAARIRDAAPESCVAASEECYRLVEAEVVAHELAREGDTTRSWAIERLARRHAGVPHVARRAVSRFVGRAQELAIIRTRLELALKGDGQALCLCGEPGIGKSRLLSELRHELAADEIPVFEVNCLAYRRSTPYFALARLVRLLCDIADDASPADAARALERVARRAGIDADEDRRLLIEFLDLGAFERSAFVPGASAGRVFALANRLLHAASRERPCVVAIEDLHWIDATSGAWLAGFVPQLPSAAVLLLATFRPEYRAEWTAHSVVTRLSLPRLNDRESAALVTSIAGERAAEPLQRRIVNHAEGNPFFLEELTWSVLADDERAGDVPSTIQGVIAARIDQLAPRDKTLLQIAAVIDTPVPHELLRAATDGAIVDIDACLQRLETAELLYPVEAAGGRAYCFRHALTQNVAYASLLTSTRRALHARIARLHAERFADAAATGPELVAHHYDEAGMSRPALEYWRLAGERAAHRSANHEAVAHFERALALAGDIADVKEQRRLRLDLHLAMGPPLMASRSFSSRDVEHSYANAGELAQSLGDEPRLFAAQWGLWLHFAHRGRVERARALCNELLALAHKLDDRDLELQAHHAGWTTELWHGDIARCREHSLAGVRLYDSERHHAQTHLYGNHDPGVCALGTTGMSAWFLGFPDEAMAYANRSGELATRLGHSYTRLVTRLGVMLLGVLRGEVGVCRDAAEEALAISSRLGVPNYVAVAKVYLGWSRAMSGEIDAGLAQIEEGLAGCRAVGAERNLASYELLLAEACLKCGHAQRGLAAIAEAERLIERTGEVRWTAEALRMRGELSLIAGESRTAVEPLLAKALDIATAQGARGFMLRSATSLARVRTGEHSDDARRMLETIYGAYDQGSETADLRRARGLLEELSS